MNAAAEAARVLVVEDDPHLAAGVIENLRAEGYEVSTAGHQRIDWSTAPIVTLYVPPRPACPECASTKYRPIRGTTDHDGGRTSRRACDS